VTDGDVSTDYADSTYEEMASSQSSLASGLTHALEHSLVVGSLSKKARRLPLSTKDKESLRVSLSGMGGQTASSGSASLVDDKLGRHGHGHGRRSLRSATPTGPGSTSPTVDSSVASSLSSVVSAAATTGAVFSARITRNRSTDGRE